jgi:hypothetical protein
MLYYSTGVDLIMGNDVEVVLTLRNGGGPRVLGALAYWRGGIGIGGIGGFSRYTATTSVNTGFFGSFIRYICRYKVQRDRYRSGRMQRTFEQKVAKVTKEKPCRD